MFKDAFISWVESVAATTPGSRAELQLKVAAMYHPSIYFPVDTGVVEGVREKISKDAGIDVAEVRNLFRSVDEIEGIYDAREILSICCTPEDAYAWDTKGNIKAGLRGAVHRSLAADSSISIRQLYKKMKEPGVEGYGWTREAAYYAVAATGAANAWRQINQVFQCDLICFNEAAAYAAKSRISSEISKADSSLLDTIEIAVPSVANLGWDHVFELRENRAVDAFRIWAGNHGDPKESRDIIEGLWSAFSDTIPNVKGAVLKGIASNIPLPIPVNPASVAFAAQDVRRALRYRQEHAVTIFFHELWRSTTEQK